MSLTKKVTQGFQSTEPTAIYFMVLDIIVQKSSTIILDVGCDDDDQEESSGSEANAVIEYGSLCKVHLSLQNWATFC